MPKLGMNATITKRQIFYTIKFDLIITVTFGLMDNFCPCFLNYQQTKRLNTCKNVIFLLILNFFLTKNKSDDFIFSLLINISVHFFDYNYNEMNMIYFTNMKFIVRRSLHNSVISMFCLYANKFWLYNIFQLLKGPQFFLKVIRPVPIKERITYLIFERLRYLSIYCCL